MSDSKSTIVIGAGPAGVAAAHDLSTLGHNVTIFEREQRAGGMLSYFEYMYVRPLRKSISFGSGRQRMVEVNRIMQDYCNAFRIGRDRVWMNCPPAWVQHLRTESTG